MKRGRRRRADLASLDMVDAVALGYTLYAESMASLRLLESRASRWEKWWLMLRGKFTKHEHCGDFLISWGELR